MIVWTRAYLLLTLPWSMWRTQLNCMVSRRAHPPGWTVDFAASTWGNPIPHCVDIYISVQINGPVRLLLVVWSNDHYTRRLITVIETKTMFQTIGTSYLVIKMHLVASDMVLKHAIATTFATRQEERKSSHNKRSQHFSGNRQDGRAV